MAVSLRGLVEPSRITRSELRRNRKSYIADIEERQRENKMSRAEQEERLGELEHGGCVLVEERSRPPCQHVYRRGDQRSPGRSTPSLAVTLWPCSIRWTTVSSARGRR